MNENEIKVRENILILNMREERRWFLQRSVVYGILFTVCLYKNMSGITFPVLAAVLILFSGLFLRKSEIRIKKESVCYAAGILLLGISTFLTANGFFHFFNSVGMMLLFIMGMIHQLYDDHAWGFLDYTKNFFLLIGTWIFSFGELFRKNSETYPHPESGKTDQTVDNFVKSPAEGKKLLKNKKQLKQIALGCAAAFCLLLIVLPLLLSSDAIFRELFQRMFAFVNLIRLFRGIDAANIVGIVLTFLLGTISLYTFFAGMFRKNLEPVKENRQGSINSVTGITFAGILAAVYVLYSGIQILFLFLRLDSGLPEGTTYSQYAHEGFWQLLFVSIINFGAVVICLQIFEENKILKTILCLVSLCTCVMILSACWRMILYVNAYHLTFLRVLVLWFLGVLMLIFFGVIFGIFRKSFRLFRYITLIVSVCYIGFSFAKTDRMIAEYNIRNTEEMNENDLSYLVYGLSEDAVPVIAEIDVSELEHVWMKAYLDEYFEIIRQGSQNQSLRSFNYARSQAKEAADQWIENEE